eukprot:1186878-Prorocentrum_minimum.AAC.4
MDVKGDIADVKGNRVDVKGNTVSLFDVSSLLGGHFFARSPRCGVCGMNGTNGTLENGGTSRGNDHRSFA